MCVVCLSICPIEGAILDDWHHLLAVYNYGLHRWRAGKITEAITADGRIAVSDVGTSGRTGKAKVGTKMR
jgi:hypothetical protein